MDDIRLFETITLDTLEPGDERVEKIFEVLEEHCLPKKNIAMTVIHSV